MQPEELKSKARELERAGQLQSAVEIYRQLADDDDAPSATLWMRIGDLQLRGDDREAARASVLRAIDLFGTAGQRNNALAAALQLLDRDPADSGASLSAGLLAVQQGFRQIARSSARAILEGGDPALLTGESSDLFVRYLERYPDDLDLARTWSDELVRLGRRTYAAEQLAALADRLRAGDDTQAAVWFRDAADRLAPESSEPQPSPQEDGGARGGNAALDLIGHGPFPTESAEETPPDRLEILPLEGLEPTHESWPATDLAAGDEPDPIDETDALPLIYPDADPAEAFPGGGDGAPPPISTTAGDAPPESWGDPHPVVPPSRIPEPEKGRNDPPSNSHETDVEPFASPGDAPDPAPVNRRTGGRGDLREGSRDKNLEDDSDQDGEPLPLLKVPGRNLSDPPPPAHRPVRPGGAPAPRDLPLDASTPPEADLDRLAVERELHALVQHQVEAADPTTHYDLGVAFKEMGLLEEALAQLAAALNTGFNPYAALEVLGEILVGRGEHEIAARLLRHGAPTDAARDHELVGLLYWLGRSEESLGNIAEARQILRRVVDADPTFKDASARLQRSASPGF